MLPAWSLSYTDIKAHRVAKNKELMNMHSVSCRNAGSGQQSRRLFGIGLTLVLVLVMSIASEARAQSNTGHPAAVLSVLPPPNSLCYKSYLQDYRWEPNWACNGQQSGTTGQSRRIEAVTIANTMPGTNLCVTGHFQDQGWLLPLSCITQGHQVTLGTAGSGRRLEALYFEVRQGTTTASRICATGHVQNVGWQYPPCGQIVTVGTTARSLRLEAFTASFAS
jgi:hypothetical protein